MIANGSNVIYVQRLLGHRRLETTQIYTALPSRKSKQPISNPAQAQKHGGSRARPNALSSALPLQGEARQTASCARPAAHTSTAEP